MIKLDKGYIKKYVSLFMLIVINFLFSTKYLGRITDYYLAISLIFILVQVILLNGNRYIDRYTKSLKYVNILLVLFFIGISFFIFSKVTVESLNVDRWSVITSFWENFEKGEYVYFARSNVGNPPGPMPFYFIIALPFYLLGELGYLSIVGLIVFLLVLHYNKINISQTNVLLLFLLISPFFLWEVVSRSSIFLNGTLVLFSISYFLRNDKVDHKRLIISGIAFGLLMSTRNVFAIPYIIACIYALKSKKISFGNIILLGLIALFIFALTFLPFVYGHIDEFMSMNPFIVQSTFLIPFYYIFIFLLMALGAAFLCKNVKDVYFYSGLVLFLSIVIYLIYHTVTYGFEAAFWQNSVDISYFIFCIPFCLLYYSLSRQSELKK